MKTLFITPVGEVNSLTTITLGVVKALEAAGLKVGFLKPIAQAENRTYHLYKDLFNKNTPSPIATEDVDSNIRKGNYSQILEDVIAKLEDVSKNVDVVVVEGLIPDPKTPFANNLNVNISRTLCSGVIFAGNSGNNNDEEIAEYLDIYAKLYNEAHTWFAGYIINRVTNTNLSSNITAKCQSKFAQELNLLGAIPYDDTLPGSKETIDFIADNLSLVSLMEELEKPRSNRMPPAAFRSQLIKIARNANKRIVLPEGNEIRTIRAAIICAEKEIARCVLLGDRPEIEQIAQDNGLVIPDSVEIINPANIREQYVEGFVELRKHRGATEETAREALQNNVVLGTMMLAKEDVDGLVSGAAHTTADTIRPALQLISTDKNASIVSSIFFMLMPDQVHVYGDCAVNPTPTPEQLADIAIQSAESAKAFGIDPKVAMISYSTGASGAGEAVEAVAKATKIAQEKAPNLVIDGPLQFDAACVPSVGKQKAPNSPVAGHATVFIYPDLNTGNTTYKAVQRSANIVSIGPMLQGLRKPVNDLSRGALVDDIVYTIAITAIQAITK